MNTKILKILCKQVLNRHAEKRDSWVSLSLVEEELDIIASEALNLITYQNYLKSKLSRIKDDRLAQIYSTLTPTIGVSNEH